MILAKSRRARMVTATTSHVRCKRLTRRQGCSAHRARRSLHETGFTLTELIVTIGLLAVLLALLFPALVKVRAAQRSTACTANLRQIGTAFHIYAQDNAFRLPVPALANRSWEQMLGPYCKGTFVCPADRELATIVGSSYDWRDTGIAHTTLAGRSVAETLRPSAIIAF